MSLIFIIMFNSSSGYSWENFLSRTTWSQLTLRKEEIRQNIWSEIPRRNKTKYLIWNSIKLKFVKNNSIANTAKNLGYIKCYSSSSTRPVKSPSNYIRYNCLKICSWSRRPKTILEIRKKDTFLQFTNNPNTDKFFKDFPNHRKKANNRAVVLTVDLSPTLRDHWWNLTKIWKTRLLQTLLKSSVNMQETPGSQFFRIMTGIQSGPDAFDESKFVMTFLIILS